MGHLADLTKKAYEAANRGDLDALVEMLTPDIEFWDVGRPPVRGTADVELRLAGFWLLFQT